MTTYKNCQSCGMPLKKDPGHGGTEANGNKSLKYFSYCYVGGQFQKPEIDTAEKMQVFCKGKLMEMGFPGFLAGMFTKGIPNLERWKKGSW
ncbi:MAG: zinc ribbon domain-containing protein [Saprospiraceae bacterium]|nr:zinc ribbon domain-containing protein [Candidatus Opimibacter iunctus]